MGVNDNSVFPGWAPNFWLSIMYYKKLNRCIFRSKYCREINSMHYNTITLCVIEKSMCL